jgi:hypothetical protein
MKTLFWLLLIGALGALCGWIVIGPWTPRNPAAILLVVALFAAPNIGAIWMMYVAVRYEANPFPFVALAFIPFSFLWYYFDRFRFGRHMTRDSIAAKI